VSISSAAKSTFYELENTTPSSLSRQAFAMVLVETSTIFPTNSPI